MLEFWGEQCLYCKLYSSKTSIGDNCLQEKLKGNQSIFSAAVVSLRSVHVCRNSSIIWTFFYVYYSNSNPKCFLKLEIFSVSFMSTVAVCMCLFSCLFFSPCGFLFFYLQPETRVWVTNKATNKMAASPTQWSRYHIAGNFCAVLNSANWQIFG